MCRSFNDTIQAFDLSIFKFARSVAEGSNFARMFACNVGCIDIEADLMMVWMNLPADLTENLIFKAGDLNTINGTVNLIRNSRFHEYIVNKYRPLIRFAERHGVEVKGRPIEATTMLELFLTETQIDDKGPAKMILLTSYYSTEVH